MPRRSILSAAERESLLAMPDTKDDLIRHYTFSESDLSIIRQRRGPANRLGFAVQLCYLRFPGVILGVDEPPFSPLLKLVADQLKVNIESWGKYGQREQTRREHLVELQTVFGFQPFTMSHYRQAVHTLTELAMQTDKGIVLASALIEHLRRQSIILPALNAIERASAEAITRANRRIYDSLAEPLSDAHRRRLDDLLKRRDNGKTTWLAWLRQSPVKPNSRHMLEHIERLKAWQALDLPSGIERPAITCGAAAPRSAQANSGRYGRCNRLNVLYFPFSEATLCSTECQTRHPARRGTGPATRQGSCCEQGCPRLRLRAGPARERSGRRALRQRGRQGKRKDGGQASPFIQERILNTPLRYGFAEHQADTEPMDTPKASAMARTLIHSVCSACTATNAAA